MNGTAILFLGFVAVTATVCCGIVARFGSTRAAVALATGLLVWLAYVGTLSGFGVVADTTLRPPGIAYVVAPVFVFVFFVIVRSAVAGRLALSIPIPLLIGAQAFRIGVELFLHQLWHEGLVPKTMTYDGANFDLWIGVSAPLAAWIARGSAGKRVAIAWNVAGLLSLANVVVRSALTAPGTSNLLHVEVANRAIGTFPYTFIAGFLAPLAVVLHVLALRALAARRVPSTVESDPTTERASP